MTDQEKIANGECVSPGSTDDCGSCVDVCKASYWRSELRQLKQSICEHQYDLETKRCIYCNLLLNGL